MKSDNYPLNGQISIHFLLICCTLLEVYGLLENRETVYLWLVSPVVYLTLLKVLHFDFLNCRFPLPNPFSLAKGSQSEIRITLLNIAEKNKDSVRGRTLVC